MSNENSSWIASFDFRGENQLLEFVIPEPSSRLVFYSADFGGYSGTTNIVKSASNCPDIQFVFFTDVPSIPECPVNLTMCHVTDNTSDKRLAAKYFKINSGTVLGKSVVRSLWIDSNMILKPGIGEFCEEFNNADLTVIKHDKRNKISEEISEIIRFGKDSDRVLYESVKDLSSRFGNYDDLGLFQGRFLYRIHNERVVEFEQLWWSLILKYSIRDQLTLPIAVQYSRAITSILPPATSSEFYDVVSHRKYKFNVKNSSHMAYLRYLKGLLWYRIGFFMKRVMRKLWLD